MEIMTNSIKDDIEIQLNKTIQEITREDLLNIKQITINTIGVGKNVQKVNYNEILHFENLEELNIFNCMINKILMTNILKLSKLKKLKVYDSEFVDFINDEFTKLQLEELIVNNCLGLKNITLKNLKYLELKNINIDFLIKDIEVLNIISTDIDISSLRLVNVKKIIISEQNYSKGRNFDNIRSDIIVMNDRMEIVKEINHG